MAPITTCYKAFYDAVLADVRSQLTEQNIMTSELEEAFSKMTVSKKHSRKKTLSGYQLFLKESKNSVNASGKEKLMAQSKMWTMLSESEKLVYNNRAKELSSDTNASTTQHEEEVASSDTVTSKPASSKKKTNKTKKTAPVSEGESDA